MRARAIYACIAEGAGEITFDAGSSLSAIADSAEDGWLTGTVDATGQRGLFPATYAELQPEPSDDPAFLHKLRASNLLPAQAPIQALNSFAANTPPAVPTKSAAVLSRAADLNGGAKRVVPQAPPVTAPKPRLTAKYPQSAPVDAGDMESQRQREREAAELWEAKHGLKSAATVSTTTPSTGGGSARPVKPSTAKPPVARPPVATKPAILSKPVVFDAVSTPSAAPSAASRQPPPVPQRSPSTSTFGSTTSPSLRSASTPSMHSVGTMQPVHPAYANDAPSLPYSARRQATVVPVQAPIEQRIQPAPKNLINQFNRMGFEDSFDPQMPQQANKPVSMSATFAAKPSAAALPPRSIPARPSNAPAEPSPIIQPSLSQPPSLSSSSSSVSPALASQQGGIPLTASRHMQGPPRPKPAPRKQLSYVNRQPVLTQNHPGYNLPAQAGAASGATSPVHSPLATTVNYSNGSNVNGAIPSDALARYSNLFKRLDKQYGKHGYLTSDQVHAVVVRCRLPDDLMRRIWALSDRNLNGKFGPGEFNLIMHLSDRALAKDPIPETLSVDLIQSAYRAL
ncbi:Intersectin 1 (SH3 domain protein) [Coemansia sp. Benny D115]|nr:Intersectin 1 (SH3 domain protein) [Coemansia sp. Benny D115]